MFKLLFTAAGRRVELIQAFRQSFSNHNIDLQIITTDLNPKLAPACYFADVSYELPRCNEAHYFDTLQEICRRERVDLLIPLYEPEFLILSHHRDELKKLGITLLLSSEPALKTALDKWETFNFFTANNFQTPKTTLDNSVWKEDDLPVLVKPRCGMGAQGITSIHCLDQLQTLKPDSGVLYQQYVSGIEYTLDILADFNGKVVAVVPRERLEVRSGEVSKSKTVKRTDLIAMGRQIVETLGVIGPVTIQCIDTGEAVYWIEINPRFGGGVPLTIAAGVDYPYLLYQMAKGESVAPLIGRFKDNLTMLRYDQAVYF
jgi:carbamoyl-phosphate synthase large subunit